MKRILKPFKPYKPKKEHICKKYILNLKLNEQLPLNEIIPLLPQNVSLSDLILEINQEFLLSDVASWYIRIYYFEKNNNKNYDEQLKQYKLDYIKYKKEYSKWKKQEQDHKKQIELNNIKRILQNLQPNEFNYVKNFLAEPK